MPKKCLYRLVAFLSAALLPAICLAQSYNFGNMHIGRYTNIENNPFGTTIYQFYRGTLWEQTLPLISDTPRDPGTTTHEIKFAMRGSNFFQNPNLRGDHIAILLHGTVRCKQNAPRYPFNNCDDHNGLGLILIPKNDFVVGATTSTPVAMFENFTTSDVYAETCSDCGSNASGYGNAELQDDVLYRVMIHVNDWGYAAYWITTWADADFSCSATQTCLAGRTIYSGGPTPDQIGFAVTGVTMSPHNTPELIGDPGWGITFYDMIVKWF